jgi:hypothetical protein
MANVIPRVMVMRNILKIRQIFRRVTPEPIALNKQSIPSMPSIFEQALITLSPRLQIVSSIIIGAEMSSTLQIPKTPTALLTRARLPIMEL